MEHQRSPEAKRRKKEKWLERQKIGEALNRRNMFNVRWDLNPLTEEQQNMQRALRYYLRIIAFEDKLEIVNTQTPSMTVELLTTLFGVYDSAVVPCDAFDGCVTVDKRLCQAW